MKTRITLTVDSVEHELGSDCVKNWDDVVCTCKRSDFGGVVRTFSSKFEFVREAYDMLLSAYVKDGATASASVAIYLLGDDWSWGKEFEAPLNFATAAWDSYVFSVSCVDNSLAAIIKARRGTKYEFTIGEDIIAESALAYDRIKLLNTVTHGIVGLGTTDDGETELGYPWVYSPLPTYILNDDETYADSPVVCLDQDTEEGSCFIEAVRDLDALTISTDITIDGGNEMEIALFKIDPAAQGGKVYVGNVADHNPFAASQRECLGHFPSVEALTKAYPSAPAGEWATVEPSAAIPGAGGSVRAFFAPDTQPNIHKQWTEGVVFKAAGVSGTVTRCKTERFIRRFEVSGVKAGDKFALLYKMPTSAHEAHPAKIRSTITSQWFSRSEPISIDAVTPAALLTALVGKMTEGKLRVPVSVSAHDPRLADTRLFAAESIRGIRGAKIYASFGDFCDWMETVFGYVHTLGEQSAPSYTATLPFSDELDDWSVEAEGISLGISDDYCPDDHIEDAPCFISSRGCFCVLNTQTLNMHTLWADSLLYNDKSGKARGDVIFTCGGARYIVGEGGTLQRYVGDMETAAAASVPLCFAHRGELFDGDAQGLVFTDARDLQSKVDSSMIYSAVVVGYPKQDYGAKCGRDEWNFTCSYTTGIDSVENKLTLQSRFRADCYGFEFVAQQRNADTKDSDSDEDVFFALCAPSQEPGVLTLARGSQISGALTDTVFNGEFSPWRCIKANEGLIASMAPGVTLRFASSDGNSAITVDGFKATGDITLGESLFSAAELEYSASDTDMPIDYSKPVSVISNGLTYTGFFTKTERSYARPAVVNCTIIVKTIEQV